MNDIKIDNDEFKQIKEAIEYIRYQQQRFTQQDLVTLLSTSISSSIVAMTILIIVNNLFDSLLLNLILILTVVIVLPLIMHIFVFLCIVPLHKYLDNKRDAQWEKIIENMDIFQDIKENHSLERGKILMLKEDIRHIFYNLYGFQEKQRDNLRTASFIALFSGLIFVFFYSTVTNLINFDNAAKIFFESVIYLSFTFIIAIIVITYGEKLHIFIQKITEKLAYFFF